MNEQEQTTQQVILSNLVKVLVWAKGMIILPSFNKRSVMYWLFGIGIGIFYGWVINPVEYVGANIYDMPTTTHEGTTLAVINLLYAVKDDEYSAGKVITLMNELYITNELLCATRETYVKYFPTQIIYVLQLLGVTC